MKNPDSVSTPLSLEDPAAEICALCLLGFEKLSRSHIVPEYHFTRMKEKEETFLSISPGGRRLEKSIQTGLFERLLCGSCERHLNEGFENDVHKLFELGAFEPSEVGMGGEFSVQTNYNSFRLYMLSILWRASAASRPPFDGFKLNPRAEEALRQSILRLEAPPPTELPFMLLTVEFDGGWTRDWITMPLHGNAKDVTIAFFVVGGILACFVLSETKIDDEIGNLFVGYDGVQRLRRLHVNHIEGLANAAQVIRDRLNEADRQRSN